MSWLCSDHAAWNVFCQVNFLHASLLAIACFVSSDQGIVQGSSLAQDQHLALKIGMNWHKLWTQLARFVDADRGCFLLLAKPFPWGQHRWRGETDARSGWWIQSASASIRGTDDTCLFLIVCLVLLCDISSDVWAMSCYLHVTSFLLSKLCLVLFMWYNFSCLSWLPAFHTAFSGTVCRDWKEHVCTISFPLQKHCFSLQKHCCSLRKDVTHVDNQICCCSSICTTSSVPQILLLARALSLEAAMQNHLWLSPSTQLSTAPSLCPTCQGIVLHVPSSSWAGSVFIIIIIIIMIIIFIIVIIIMSRYLLMTVTSASGFACLHSDITAHLLQSHRRLLVGSPKKKGHERSFRRLLVGFALSDILIKPKSKGRMWEQPKTHYIIIIIIIIIYCWNWVKCPCMCCSHALQKNSVRLLSLPQLGICWTSFHHRWSMCWHVRNCTVMTQAECMQNTKQAIPLWSAFVLSACAGINCVRVLTENLLLCRLVNIHVINTLGVAPEDVPRCIECWCTDAEHELKGKHGGGSCCSQCPSSALNTTINTYHLQFNVTYR